MLKSRVPKLDISRLTHDLKRSRQERPEGVGPGGRAVLGTMALVRENLATLESLHASGATWVEIATALSAQGARQGDDQPLTGRRLTALIASVKRTASIQDARLAARTLRPDLPRPATPRLALASDLVAPVRRPKPVSTATEEDIRREQLASIHDLLKKE